MIDLVEFEGPVVNYMLAPFLPLKSIMWVS
jgi:hypothetical protein